MSDSLMCQRYLRCVYSLRIQNSLSIISCFFRNRSSLDQYSQQHVECSHTHGHWTDWSHGVVLGNFRTYSVRDTQYIIGGTSAFVTFVGGCAWVIYGFLIHRWKATRRKLDMIDLQHRLVYRNDASATTAAVNGFWIYWTWKPWTLTWKPWVWTWKKPWMLCPCRGRQHKRANHVGFRSFGMILPALLLFGAFVVAATFSSWIAAPAYKNTVVLVKDGLQQGQCGIALFDGSSNSFDAFDVKNANDTRTAVSYSQSCYSPKPGVANSISCNFFTKKKLNYSMAGVRCPFGAADRSTAESICNLNGNKAAFQLTSGSPKSHWLLDSHDDFGINAPPKDRLKLRTQLTCSPLSQEGFTSTETGHGEEANRTVTDYNYGGAPNVASYTWQYNPAAANDNVPFEILYVRVSNARDNYPYLLTIY